MPDKANDKQKIFGTYQAHLIEMELVEIRALFSFRQNDKLFYGGDENMVSFLFLIVALIVIAIIAVLFVGTGGAVVLLVFGDVIIGGFLVYKVIKAICKK